jgi:hypothetical protein
MKIVLQQKEFESMAAAWVYENLVEKKMTSASIVEDAIELEVFGTGDEPEEAVPDIIDEPKNEQTLEGTTTY